MEEPVSVDLETVVFGEKMRSAKEYREAARISLAGNYGTVIGAYIIYTIILNILSVPSGAVMNISQFMSGMGFQAFELFSAIAMIPLSIVTSVVSMLISFGVIKITKDVTEGKKGEIADLFYCFTHKPLTVICAMLWILLYLLPPIAVFIIGGGASMALLFFFDGTMYSVLGAFLLGISVLIYCVWVTVISYSVSMTIYLYLDYPEMGARDLVTSSMRMMKGNKFRLFKLYLSYIGYYLLGFLSCGLALIWVSPNVTASSIYFYRDLKAEDNAGNVGSGYSGINESSPRETQDGYPASQGEEKYTYHQDYWN